MKATRRPNLFIAGSPKCGTTTMHDCLGKHPDIFMSKMKEPDYFSEIPPDSMLARYKPIISTEQEYLALFAKAKDEAYVGESSATFVWGEGIPAKLARYSPSAKIIILLRDPVLRAYSHYLNDVREQVETRSFARAIREDYALPRKGFGISRLYVDLGFYCPPIRRFHEAFSPEQVGVFFFEEFVKDPTAVLADVFTFLGVDPSYACEIRSPHKNSFSLPRNPLVSSLLRSWRARRLARAVVPKPFLTVMRDSFWFVSVRKPEMDDETRADLADLYREDSAELEQLLNRPVPWNVARLSPT